MRNESFESRGNFGRVDRIPFENLSNLICFFFFKINLIVKIIQLKFMSWERYLRYIGVDIKKICKEYFAMSVRRDRILMFAKSESPETFASSSASEIHDSRVFM